MTLRGATMGTTWSVVYNAEAPALPAERIQGMIEAQLAAINQALSTYIDDSEISRINRGTGSAGAGGLHEVTLSPAFATVLSRALQISAATGGAYDVTVGPLVDLWGFGRGAVQDRVPAPEEIESAREDVGYGQLVWDAPTRQLTKPGSVRIDLSSIAKGFAVDKVATVVESAGISSYLVEIGGELRSAGERPGGGPWRLAIESPGAERTGVIGALAVNDAAVATSGDYRNYFEIDGVRYSHLVDPRSGYPVTHDLVSVTVVHDDCMTADAWATALIVLGRTEALAVAEAQGLAAYLVAREGGELAVEYTDAFTRYLAVGADAPATSGY